MRNNDDLFRSRLVRRSHTESVYVAVPPLHAPSTSWWVEAGDDMDEFRKQRDQRLPDMKRARFGQTHSVLIIDGFIR